MKILLPKNSKLLSTILFLFCFLITSLHAQEEIVNSDNIPAWILVEQGKKAFREDEFGIALRYFREAIEKEGVFPEAEYRIGNVFEKEQELALAVKQYEKTLSMENALYIPEERYTILYNLAFVYEKTEKYKQYEDTLLQIIADDTLFSARENETFRSALYNNMVENGLDKLLILYRLESDFSLEALKLLGVYYYKSGRYNRAIHHFLFPLITVFSNCIDELRKKDPDYEFEETEECLRLIMREERLRNYVEKTELFKIIYYLAASLFAEGYLQRAESLWRYVVEWSMTETWRNRAEAQLSQPYIEP